MWVAANTVMVENSIIAIRSVQLKQERTKQKRERETLWASYNGESPLSQNLF